MDFVAFSNRPKQMCKFQERMVFAFFKMENISLNLFSRLLFFSAKVRR